jgi:hypothetical protein
MVYLLNLPFYDAILSHPYQLIKEQTDDGNIEDAGK